MNKSGESKDKGPSDQAWPEGNNIKLSSAQEDKVGSNQTSCNLIPKSEEEGSLSITSNIGKFIGGKIAISTKISPLILPKPIPILKW